MPGTDATSVAARALPERRRRGEPHICRAPRPGAGCRRRRRARSYAARRTRRAEHHGTHVPANPPRRRGRERSRAARLRRAPRRPARRLGGLPLVGWLAPRPRRGRARRRDRLRARPPGARRPLPRGQGRRHRVRATASGTGSRHQRRRHEKDRIKDPFSRRSTTATRSSARSTSGPRLGGREGC